MMKKLIRFASICAILFIGVINSYSVAFAEETSKIKSMAEVFDKALLLTEEEKAELQAQTVELAEKTGWNILVVTIYDAEGKIPAVYADDFYDKRTEKDSHGILILIDMDNRELYLSTSGEAIRYLTDERIDVVLDAGYSYIIDERYADCLLKMLDSVSYYYEKGIEEDQYNYDVETGAVSEYRVLTGMEVVISLLASVGMGVLIYFGIGKSYRVHGMKYEYPYRKYGKLHLISQKDLFIRKHVTHRRIEKNQGGSHSSSGRSSVHRSSSGNSHGGGGRKF